MLIHLSSNHNTVIMNGPQELTDIQRFYKDSTVFLTGATGFIGKLVLEKILRSLPVKKVFIMVRKKKEESADKRYQGIFESKAFDPLKRSHPDALQKVFIMEGDCSQPMLGMSQESQNTFIEEVNVVFHVAASVTFNDPLRRIILTNVRSTRDLITLSQKVKNLKTFVYVSTGFSNCNRREIKEEIYPAKIPAEKLIAVCENLDQEYLNPATEKIIDGWPNTYTFSKQVTEDYINRNTRGLPICIVRPTIVVSTLAEPVSAFVDNKFTLAGVMLLNGLGITRICYYQNIDTDIVPADFVVNKCIAAGWQTGASFKPLNIEVPVYHVSSVMDNPITQDQIYDGCYRYGIEIPTKQMLLYPLTFRTTCRYNYLLLRVLFHTLVGYFLDLALRIKGQTPRFADGIAKVHQLQEANEFFTTRSFFLHVKNTHKILKQMSFKDRELFNFDVRTFNWENYFYQYSKGLRHYLLEDPIETVPEGKKHLNYLRRVFIVSLIIGTICLYIIGKVFLFRVVPVIFGMILFLIRSAVC